MIDRTISHYKILEKLGSGAMGTVYKARDLKLDRLVAMKFISPGLPLEHRSRFVLEARAASALDHTNICTIYEFGETDEGDLFIAMAYCPGENLRERLLRGLLPIADALDIATQVALGLARAHRSGIVHRDIKPANIMLTPDGVVKVVDFGIAKLADDIGITQIGTPLGTVPYMSPEQIKAKALDHRTDIWSWGVVTYEMLAGERPFRAESELLTAEAILIKEPPPLIQLRPEPPLDLDLIVLRALRKMPQDRHQSAEELVRALRSVALPSGVLTAPASAPPSLASIAVLPFVNMSTEPDSEYFSDGLTEELIHALSRISNLHVVSRTSAFEFKGKPQSIRRIGEQLNVSCVVEGSVRKVGQKLRVSAQLVNVSDGYCLWSQRFDREIKDVFQIQDEIAQTIADTLPVKLGTDINRALTQRRTDNIEAYDAYLHGRFQWNKRSGEGLQRSLEYFELALAQDPRFAPAYSGVADYYIAVASWGLETPVTVWPKAKAAAKRALELDDTLAEAHASMGTIRMWYEWGWEEAEREFRRAIDLNPGHPYPHLQYNLLLLQHGRFVEAEREVRVALLSDPLSVRANSYLAGVFHYRREYDRSLKQCHKALELDPNDIELHVVIGLNYQQKGAYGLAIQALEKARELSANYPLILGPLGSVYAESGDKARALELLDQLEQTSQSVFVAHIARVMIYLGLQEHDLAFEWLEKAAETRDVLLCYLGIGPIYDRIRSDPRYAKLLHQIGLAQGAETQILTA